MPKPLRTLADLITTLEAAVVAITIGTTSGAVVWAYIAQSGPIIIPIGAVTLASGFSIFDFVQQYKRRRGIPRKRLRSVLVEWLVKTYRGFELPAISAAVFRLEVTFDDDKHATIVMKTETPDALTITSGMRLSDEHRHPYETLTPQQKTAFARFLLLQVAPLGVEFDISPPHDQMVFGVTLVYDAQFDRVRLMNGIFLMRRATAIVRNSISMALEVAPTQTTTPPRSVPDTAGSQP